MNQIHSLSILIVNYNNLTLTKDCINDLNNQINKNFKLYLVDQNSDELGTKEYLESLSELDFDIDIIINESNVDLNRVWNDFYKNTDTEFLCFLNNDVRLTNNFIDDNIKILSENEKIGVVIHVTNNLKYTKAEQKLIFEILSPPLYQGWDFCLRRSAYTLIPDSLRIFGGDDYIFVNLKDRGYEIAMTYSSPIIHYKEQTRKQLGNEIQEIHKLDGANYFNYLKTNNLTHINSTFNTDKCNKYAPDGIKLIQNNNCVFTTIIGGYDDLPKINIKNDGWDYICFTNNLNLKSENWKIIYCDTNIFGNMTDIKISRFFKTNFKKYLISYDNLLYIDARIDITTCVSEYKKYLTDVDIVFLEHPEAKSIKEEMSRVLGGKLENLDNINLLKGKYEKENYTYNNGLFAGGVLLFKNNNKTIKFFDEWWYMIKNYSHRDQLSLNYVLHNNKDLQFKTLKFKEVLSKNFKQRKRKSDRVKF